MEFLEHYKFPINFKFEITFITNTSSFIRNYNWNLPKISTFLEILNAFGGDFIINLWYHRPFETKCEENLKFPRNSNCNEGRFREFSIAFYLVSGILDEISRKFRLKSRVRKKFLGVKYFIILYIFFYSLNFFGRSILDEISRKFRLKSKLPNWAQFHQLQLIDFQFNCNLDLNSISTFTNYNPNPNRSTGWLWQWIWFWLWLRLSGSLFRI